MSTSSGAASLPWPDSFGCPSLASSSSAGVAAGAVFRAPGRCDFDVLLAVRPGRGRGAADLGRGSGSGGGLGVLPCGRGRSLRDRSCGESLRCWRGPAGGRGRHGRDGGGLRVEIREIVQQSHVRLTIRVARLDRLLDRLPAGHRGQARLQRGGHFVQPQTVCLAQPLALLCGWQRSAARDEGVDRVDAARTGVWEQIVGATRSRRPASQRRTASTGPRKRQRARGWS